MNNQVDNMNDIRILNKSANEIEFEIEDESHGVCNALRHILMEDEDVEYEEADLIAINPDPKYKNWEAK